jgi:hypothetical protein
LPVLIAALVVALTAVARLQWLLTWPTPVGRDGYYYLLQIDSIRSTGGLYFPTHFPLALYVLAGLGWPWDPTVGTKMAVVATFSLLLVAMFVLVRILTGREWAALLSILLVTVSKLHWYFLVEFASNLVSLLFFAVFVSYLARVERCGASRPTTVATTIVFIACVLSHRSAAVLAILTISAYGALIIGERRRPRLTWSLALGAAFVISSLLVFAHALVPEARAWVTANFKPLPALELSNHEFASEAWVLAAVVPIIAWLLLHPQSTSEARNPWWRHRRLILALLLVCVAVTLNPWARYRTALSGAMERMGLWSLLFVGILVPTAVAITVERGRRWTVSGLLLVAFTFAVVSGRPGPERTTSYLMERHRLAAELPGLISWVPHSAVIVAEHGTQFMITSEVGRAAVSRRPPNPAPSTKTFWLLRTGGLVPAELPQVHSRYVAEWIVVREDVLFDWIGEADDQRLHALAKANPFHLARQIGMTLARRPS